MECDGVSCAVAHDVGDVECEGVSAGCEVVDGEGYVALSTALAQ